MITHEDVGIVLQKLFEFGIEYNVYAHPSKINMYNYLDDGKPTIDEYNTDIAHVVKEFAEKVESPEFVAWWEGFKADKIAVMKLQVLEENISRQLDKDLAESDKVIFGPNPEPEK